MNDYALFIGEGKSPTNNVTLENLTLSAALRVRDARNVVLKNCSITGVELCAVEARIGASVVIESGTYYGGRDDNGNKRAALQTEDNGNIIVKGGSFDTDPSAYVDLSQYKVTQQDGMYVVSKK